MVSITVGLFTSTNLLIVNLEGTIGVIPSALALLEQLQGKNTN